MKFWTVQTKEVMEIVAQEGMYYPDFGKSRYVVNDKKKKPLYNLLLNSFNSLNLQNEKGLIFAFAKRENGLVFDFKNICDFSSFILSKKRFVYSMWNSFPSDSLIVELSISESFNPLYIDFNDFQILMPINPFIKKRYGNPGEEYTERLRENIKSGLFWCTPEYHCDLIQAHLPYIKKDDILSVYDIFRL